MTIKIIISFPHPRSRSSSERESKGFRRESNRWSIESRPIVLDVASKIRMKSKSTICQAGTQDLSSWLCPPQSTRYWLPLARVDDASHCISESYINEVRGRWGWSSRHHLALVEQVDLGCWDQEDRFRESMHQRAISIAWFILLLGPLVPNWQTGSGSQETAERPPEHWGKLGPFM